MTNEATNQNTVDMHPNLEDVYELSPMQQGMLFHTLYSPNSGEYFEQSLFTVRGELNIAAFERAWQRVLDRHPILRTSFIWEELEKPLQIVHRQVDLPFATHDWRNLSAGEQQLRLQSFIKEDRSRGFLLNIAPLIRLALFRFADDEYKFIFSRHHLVLDRWSRALLLKDIFATYHALSKGNEPSLKIARPYVDYISWLGRQDANAAERFWRHSLAGFTEPTTIDIGGRNDHRAEATDRYTEQRIQLSEAGTAKLSDFARQHRLTVNNLVQGAWALLLNRYSSKDDIVFGATVAGRPTELTGVESIVGLFINTLPVRVRMPPSMRVLPWLKELQAQQSELQQFEYSSLLDIQGWSDVPRGLPLFESILVFENLPVDSSYQPNNHSVKFTDDRGFGSTTGYPMTVLVNPGRRLGVKIVYDLTRYTEEAIQKLLIHFQTLLENLPSGAETAISCLPFLTEPEERQILADWNNTQTSFEQRGSVVELFERQTSSAPSDIAVSCQDQQLTYAELNARANQLARYLRSLGVRPEMVVGICLDRSLAMVIGLLGILKTGAAYLPLDPALPKERIAFMLEDANVAAVVTVAELSKELPPHHAKVIALDADQEGLSAESPKNLNIPVTDENLAYVIYTSGSTGKPKGVQVSHSALANFLNSMRERPGMSASDVLLSVTTLSFDIAGLEVYLPLIVGARLVVASRDETRDGVTLAKLISNSGATVMQATPATWRLLAETGWKGDAKLRILCGGEALSGDLANQLFKNGAELWNLYGPTETTIWSTLKQISSPVVEITIGNPIANTQIYVLDQRLQPVPIGVAGELYIGGHGVGRGYVNRPDLTAEKFVPDPYAAGQRLYKTGDLARYQPDGDIEYLGRLDYQVKIRGFRIELSEIESVLRQHESVLDTVVIASEDTSGDRRLVAYVVPGPKEDESVTENSLALEEAQVSRWQNVWDVTYSQTPSSRDPSFNIAGWKSSYTGESISLEEMREWVDQAVQRILSLRPKRVLDIGCGTGLLLFRIAPHCSYYLGTDLAAASIEYLQQHLEVAGEAFGDVTVSKQSADDLTGIDSGTFDTVILNSVVQYFPNLEYFLRVLGGAIQAVRPGGAVFVGDIRSLPLLKVFLTAVELQNARASLKVSELMQRVQRRMEQEKELVLDPAFFLALKRDLPQISDVEIQLKRGNYHNELTQFRYDVLLHIEQQELPLCDGRWLDWEKDKVTLEGLRRILNNEEPQFVSVSGVPNLRIATEVSVLETLEAELELETVAELRVALQSVSMDKTAKDPEEFWALGDDTGYSVEVTWSKTGVLGKYDVLLRRHDIARVQVPEQATEPVVTTRRSYANSPAREIWPRLASDLRQYLQRRLPDYMLPAIYVELSRLPLTPNGKIDRQALPDPDNLRPEQQEDYVAPRTPLEQDIANIWEQVLKVKSVGIFDNFFALGGHSLLATQVISRMHESMQIEMPLRAIFEQPTIAGLALAAAQRQARRVEAETIQMLSKLAQFSDAEAQQLLESERLNQVNHTASPEIE